MITSLALKCFILKFISINRNTSRSITSSKITTTAADSMTVTERTEKASAAVAAILANYPPGVTPPTAEEN